jgi:predicted metal-dependent peptidase
MGFKRRPSRRTGEAILPALKSHQIDIIVAIDTSGSISQEEVNEFGLKQGFFAIR